eukprot:99866-Pyramimonas_sp.AAC.1
MSGVSTQKAPNTRIEPSSSSRACNRGGSTSYSTQISSPTFIDTGLHPWAHGGQASRLRAQPASPPQRLRRGLARST